MRHDPKGMRPRPHALLGLQGGGRCTLKSWLHLETLLAAAAVGLYPPSPVGLRCAVGFGHPKWQGRNARPISWENNGTLEKHLANCLGPETKVQLSFNNKENLIYLFFRVQRGGDGNTFLPNYYYESTEDISIYKLFPLSPAILDQFLTSNDSFFGR